MGNGFPPRTGCGKRKSRRNGPEAPAGNCHGSVVQGTNHTSQRGDLGRHADRQEVGFRGTCLKKKSLPLSLSVGKWPKILRVETCPSGMTTEEIGGQPGQKKKKRQRIFNMPSEGI